MTLRSITMELRFDPEDDEKHKIVEEAAKVAAKHLLTTALLIADKRKPTIALHGSDFFAGTEEISLADDLDASIYSGGTDGAP